MQKYVPLAFSLLAGLSLGADAGPRGRTEIPLSDAEKYSRPITEENPFGIDYGFDPVFYLGRAQGVPSHQLSMFHAQIVFAESKCTTTSKPTRDQRVFYNFFVYAYDQDLDKSYKLLYAQAVDDIKSNYQNAWDGMDESQRSGYCAEYWNDVSSFREGKLSVRASRYSAARLFYLAALSPFSLGSIEEFERKAKAKEEELKSLGAIMVIGQAIIGAAGISALNDGLSAQRSGDYATAQMRYAQSRSLYQAAGGVAAVTTQASISMNSQTTPLQEPPQAGCQTLDHFAQYDAEPDSDVWKRYQSLSSGCEALNRLRIK